MNVEKLIIKEIEVVGERKQEVFIVTEHFETWSRKNVYTFDSLTSALEFVEHNKKLSSPELSPPEFTYKLYKFEV